MGMIATQYNGAKVYNNALHHYKQAEGLEQQIKEQINQVAKDPNLSPDERDELLGDLKESLQEIRDVKNYCTTDNRIGRKDNANDKNFDLINDKLASAEDRLIDVTGDYTDALNASEVDAPPKPKLPTLPSDLILQHPTIDMDNLQGVTLPQVNLSNSIDTQGTQNTTASSDVFAHVSNPNNSAQSIAQGIANNSIKMSGEDLRALATSDPQKFQEIMSELSKLPGGEMIAMSLQQDMQNHLQKMNRMFSLMSNMTQALHDTQKALINNIRV